MQKTLHEERKVVRNKKREKRERLKLRSSRLALMVNDMLALWLGLAQAPELLKYLHGVQSERLVHFESAGAEKERERERERERESWATFYLFTALR